MRVPRALGFEILELARDGFTAKLTLDQAGHVQCWGPVGGMNYL